MLRLEEANTHTFFFFYNLLYSLITMSASSLLNTNESSTTTLKFLYSYGGKILPRYPDAKLRYHGGQTRVLSVDRSISFSELVTKLSDLCGRSVSLRCQLPTEDLDALVSITSDEDLVNLIEEYDHQSSRLSKSLKIRAFLSLPKKPESSDKDSRQKSVVGNSRHVSDSLSLATSGSGSGSGSSSSASTTTHEAGSPKSPQLRFPVAGSGSNRCIYNVPKPPVRYIRPTGKVPCYVYGNHSRSYLVHNGNHWQQ